MMRDRLYLLELEFADPGLPDRNFYCPDGTTLNGLLAAFPDRAANLDVIRVPFPRPRVEVIKAVGEANQALPLLVWDGGFTNDMPKILEELHRRHGFPEPHP